MTINQRDALLVQIIHFANTKCLYLENLDTKTTKISDPSNILNYNVTKDVFEVAITGKAVIITKKIEDSKGKKDQRKLKDKTQIDVLSEQALGR